MTVQIVQSNRKVSASITEASAVQDFHKLNNKLISWCQAPGPLFMST